MLVPPSDSRSTVSDLRHALAHAEESLRDAQATISELATQNQEVLNLYVASQRLHASLDRADVLAGIQEIVVNLIGSEELGIFELAEDGKALRLASSFGLEPGRWERIPASHGDIGAKLKEGGAWVRLGPGPLGEELTAVVPLKVGDLVLGALAVFRLLPQKAELKAADRELFELISVHGGLALYATAMAAARK